MLKKLGNEYFYIDVSLNDSSAFISGGKMGDFDVLQSPLFEMELKGASGESLQINSQSIWSNVFVREQNEYTEIIFSGHETAKELCIILKAKEESNAIVWSISVVNDCSEWSVMSISYPSPVLKNPEFNLFVPYFGGRIMSIVGNKGYCTEKTYPGTLTMQYFAAYSKKYGVYLGVEDEKAAVKKYSVNAQKGTLSLQATFYAIGGSDFANSFDVFGEIRWQGFEGDWYDAAMIYADFVYKKATWLPKRNRPDTADKFKSIPFWISDYIPNIKSQGNNKPMLLSAGSDIYEPEYWYKAPIELQKALGDVPIGYHFYNWHKIPFNIEYPHFLPAKETFIENAPKLRDKNIYVMPYINAVSWEKRDGEMGHEINFDNTGAFGSVILENGEILHEIYPQTTLSGHNSYLVQMCPSFNKWHNIIEKLTREMEQTLPIDGIYYDQIAATPACPCYNSKHNHTLGGGSFWVDGDNQMMQRIGLNKPKDFFYFTESCAEPYMKSFDGYLTWNWVYPGDVPAFATIYAGYVQMIGRVTDGKKKDDLGFFKYCTALSLVYGQQLGWCKADVIWREEWLSFLKNAVKVRYELTDVFNFARMLRPPAIKTSLPKLITEAGLHHKDNVESEAIISGAWYNREWDETVIIAVNIANESASFTLSFDIVEYGINDKLLPNEFTVEENKCTIQSTIKKNEIRVWKIK